ncbi:hypothetical protein EWM64_g10216, partial [Hericium alpestre]
MTGSVSQHSVSQPNGVSIFLSLRAISTSCAGHAEIVFATGALNCSVAFSGASERENPLVEKSVQLLLVRVDPAEPHLLKLAPLQIRQAPEPLLVCRGGAQPEVVVLVRYITRRRARRRGG